MLAQKVVTRSARAAVSKISADALLAKALSVRRSQAGSLLKTIRKVNAKKLQESDILVGHRFHTAGAEPYFFDNSYTHKKQHPTNYLPILFLKLTSSYFVMAPSKYVPRDLTKTACAICLCVM